MSWQLPFPIIGRSDLLLNDKWKDCSESYLSLCTKGFPNMFVVMSPNSIVSTGPFIEVIEAGVGYAVNAVSKMQRESIKGIDVKGGAVRGFDGLIQVSMCAVEGGESLRDMGRGLTVTAWDSDRSISRRYAVVARASDQPTSEDGKIVRKPT